MHECVECGQLCDCDGEDTWNDPPANCRCAREDEIRGDGADDDWCDFCMGDGCPECDFDDDFEDDDEP